MESKYYLSEPYQFFMYADAVKVWDEYFPTDPLDTSRVIDALKKMPIQEGKTDTNRIMVEIVKLQVTCWDLVTLAVRVAYQLMVGQTPSHPITGRPLTWSTTAMIAMSYSLLEKPELDKVLASLDSNVVAVEDLSDALSFPKIFFTQYICDKISDGAPCKYKSLKEFIDVKRYNQDLLDQVQMLRLSEDSRYNVSLAWNDLTSIALQRYELTDSMSDAITQVMVWLGSDILSDLACTNDQIYNKGRNRYELFIMEKHPELQHALNSCTLSLFVAYMQKYEPLDFGMHVIGLAAFILAYKALALDDTKGCWRTLDLPMLLSKCKGCKEKDIKKIEVDMHVLVNQTPCKEQFAKFMPVEKVESIPTPAFRLNYLDGEGKRKER
jgi:hypothetical protein